MLVSFMKHPILVKIFSDMAVISGRGSWLIFRNNDYRNLQFSGICMYDIVE